MILTAFAVMIAATLMQHLGLAEAIATNVAKICSCNQCFVFWASILALLYSGCNIIQAAVLSILFAYLSNWFIVALVHLQKLFNLIYYGKEKDADNKRSERRGKEEEKKPVVKYNFTTATTAILVPRFRGICPNC